MAKGPKLPPPPVFSPPPAYTPPPDPQSTVPQVISGTGIMKRGQKIEAMLPSWLQLNQNPVDQNLVNQAADNYFQQNVAPQIEAAKASVAHSGQGYGSYGGGLVGQITAQGQLDKFNAGLANQQQQLNNVFTGRQSYYSGGPALAQQQNALDVQRGLGVAGLQSSNTGMLNNYNFGSSGMLNDFNLANYKNALNAYNLQQQAAANRMSGLLGLGTGLGGLLGQGIGKLWGMRSAVSAAPAAGGGILQRIPMSSIGDYNGFAPFA